MKLIDNVKVQYIPIIVKGMGANKCKYIFVNVLQQRGSITKVFESTW